MTVEDRLVALEAEMRGIKGRKAISDCIKRSSRGNDRFDAELVAGRLLPTAMANMRTRPTAFSSIQIGIELGHQTARALVEMIFENSNRATDPHPEKRVFVTLVARARLCV